MKEDKGYVYVIEAIDITAVKVGFSRNLDKRLKNLAATQALSLRLVWKVHTKYGRWAERAAHSRLNGAKIRAEWFAVDAEHAVDAIKSSLRMIYRFESRESRQQKVNKQIIGE